jgi:hypothetical protein
MTTTYQSINSNQRQEKIMSQIQDRPKTPREIKAEEDALIAANKAHDDAKRRPPAIKHVRELSPTEIKAEERRRGLRSY